MPNPKGIRKAGQDIYSVNFAEYLPDALKHDPKMRAIAEAVTKEALSVSNEIEKVLIYSRIDELPEALIDILAYDMHVDWYDYSFPLSVKRALLKGSVKVHKKMGTKYAVESVLQSIHPKSHIEEWFEYGGSHHCFRIVINADNKEYEIDLNKIIKNVNLYKRLAAHLESVNLERKKEKRLFIMPAEGIFIGRRININPYNKSEHKYININQGSATLIYVSFALYRKEKEIWKGQ